MNFSWSTFALQAANFLVLVWLLRRFLFKPVKAMVARRQEEVSRALTEASAEKASAEQLRQQLEATKSAISAEHQKMIDEARANIFAERQKNIEEAQREADRIREQALKRLEEERVSAGEKLYQQTVELATKLAEQLLRGVGIGSVEQAFRGQVIAYLDHMAPQERAKILPRNGSSSVLVTTAHPLDAQEQSEWQVQLATKLGPGLGITFDTDPALIGGAVLTFPHAILNFSWRDSLTLALKEIYGHERSR